MKTIITILTILLAAMFIVSCNENSVVGADDVSVLEDATFEITEYLFTSTELIVKGTVSNDGDATFYPPWYIEAEFYADSTFTTKFGGTRTTKNYSLAPGENTLWQLTYSSSLIIESDYPDFRIKNLRAYMEE
ncbi:MAG: hypothetical protein KAS53_12190 [Candidatus Cloacimonetes bacterium]|nr:hypothetical protein [Candidatus Cloacimonadota bacterium]